MSDVWDENWFGSMKTLDVHIGTLRRKLGDDPSQPRYLHTVRGVGFRLARRTRSCLEPADAPAAGAGYLLVLAILAFEVPLAISLDRRVHAEVQSQARSQADVLAATASDLLAPGDAPASRRSRARVAKLVRGRVVVVDANARVLADSAGAGASSTS